MIGETVGKSAERTIQDCLSDGVRLPLAQTNVVKRHGDVSHGTHAVSVQFRHQGRPDAESAIRPEHSLDASDRSLDADVVLPDCAHALRNPARAVYHQKPEQERGTDDDGG